jgi:predicted Ser/Thr protein kinase
MDDKDIINALQETKGDIKKAADLVSAKRTVSGSDLGEGDRPLKQKKSVSFSPQKVKEIEIPIDCRREEWTEGVFIAEGSSAKVFKVKRKNESADDNTYAIKINPFKRGAPIDGKDLFKNEVLFSLKAAELKVGPKIYDYGLCLEKDGSGFYYIVQELLGDPLEKFVRRGETPKIFPARLFVDILEKVYTLEKNGIRHNDLGTKNIIKNPDRIYIIDYGSAEETKKEKKDPNLYINELWYLAGRLGHGSPPDQIPFFDMTRKKERAGLRQRNLIMTPEDKEFYYEIERNFFQRHWPELYDHTFYPDLT